MAAVHLALLQGLWSEPESYKDSGGSIPHEWRGLFDNIIVGDERKLLENEAESAMRSARLPVIQTIPELFFWCAR